MSGDYIGPELTDAACDVVGIAIQFLQSLKCRQILHRVPREDGQIHLHPVDQGTHERSNAVSILSTQRFKKLKALFQSLHEGALTCAGLMRHQRGLDGTDGRPVEKICGELSLRVLQQSQPPTSLNE